MVTPNELLQKAKRIRLVISDCDGVLTDGGVYYGAEGEVLKRFNIRDGMGVERLKKLCGVETGIMTGELSPSVSKRAEKLRIEELHLGIKEKRLCLDAVLARRGLKVEEVAFIGDDVNDLSVLGVVGLSACPSDAMPEVKKVCDFISQHPGGFGAFRDLAESIIKAQCEE